MSRRRRSSGRGQIIQSEKNVVNNFTAVAAGAQGTVNIALAKNAADNTVVTEVTRRCKIFKIWVELWVSASEAITEGVTTGIDMFLIKNPGSNLTLPGAQVVGSSNEKKFVFKQWKGLIASRKEGFPAYTWRGWVKVPKVYQRMGTDDVIQLAANPTGANALICSQFIYKWYT